MEIITWRSNVSHVVPGDFRMGSTLPDEGSMLYISTFCPVCNVMGAEQDLRAAVKYKYYVF